MFQLNGDILELSLLFDVLKQSEDGQFWNVLILIAYWAEFSDLTIGYTVQGFELLKRLSSYLLVVV